MSAPRDLRHDDRDERRKRLEELRREYEPLSLSELAIEHERLWSLVRAGVASPDERLRLRVTQRLTLETEWVFEGRDG